ncbi:putative EF-hand domain-containing family member B [Monocercomonoides exilis]|uniref:putative EF-hand domain-containing family member B n=1 Tax=Monocercomonoides exilis TaxID=2049356 RepID=UPI00355A3A7E|nr:putative EF-hand domain-containing family member B [Monocercomonoides exilis]|eukprot:MONOS_9696.1-p1 / transcript=MONOS_9696.1 / gene=MONOS_9696 / organism=Monocercomonoides_exilis_PA203 / gene_product=unspecified product / transcript_product=unspecified product / location=Mono_scaffold00410:24893-27234(+) / protein_length=562 / sequence_SO=supercontig / SO=protein_coding / is_pseudo=false
MSSRRSPPKDPSTLPPAGIPPPVISVTAADCTKTPEEPPVQPVQERFWRSNIETGDKVIHWGIQGHQMPPEYHTYGIPSGDRSVTAKQLVNPPPLSEFAEALEQRKESQYKDAAHVPLGRATTRNYKWSGPAGDPEFSFGTHVVPSEPAKELVTPSGGTNEEPEQVHRMYVKTFGDYAPGETISRDYKWGKMGDPTTAVFGSKPMSKALLSGSQTKELVQPEPGDSPFSATSIVKGSVGEYDRYHHPEVGKPNPLKARDYRLPEDYAFGKTYKGDGESSETLYRHPYLAGGTAAAEPDADLGRSLIKGRWGSTKVRDFSGDAEMRPCGVPSIRTDIPAPSRKSVADNQNYGEDPGSKTLISPLPWAELGINETDFLQPIEREKLHKLIMTPSNPFNLSEEEFQMLCDQAEAHSLDTIESEIASARVNSRSFSSTDKSPRLALTIKEKFGSQPRNTSGTLGGTIATRGYKPGEEGYLCIDAFRTAYHQYEAKRVEEEVVESMERELKDMTVRGHQMQRERSVPRERTLMNQFAQEAVTEGIKKHDVPLAFGKTGRLEKKARL